MAEPGLVAVMPGRELSLLEQGGLADRLVGVHQGAAGRLIERFDGDILVEGYLTRTTGTL